MPISGCKILNDFKGSANTWQNGFFRMQSFEYALYEAILEIFNKNKKQWEKSQVVTDTLLPYFNRVQVPIVNFEKEQLIKYPTDYSQFSMLTFFTKSGSKDEDDKAGVLCKGIKILDINRKCRPLREEEKLEALETSVLIEKEITKVDNKRWAGVLEHRTIGPTVTRPYCTQYNNGFMVAPHNIGYAVLYYLAKPQRPVFKYHTGNRDEFICDSCSTILLGEEQLPDLMARIKTKYASFIGSQTKYAEGQKEKSIVD